MDPEVDLTYRRPDCSLLIVRKDSGQALDRLYRKKRAIKQLKSSNLSCEHKTLLTHVCFPAARAITNRKVMAEQQQPQ